MNTNLFLPLMITATLGAGCGGRGLPAEELCAAIEAQSDCDTQACVRVACYDATIESGESMHPNNCSLIDATYQPTAHTDALASTAREVLETECSASSFALLNECGDTGAQSEEFADVYVSCAAFRR